MAAHVRRGPQTLTADRRQARPMAHRRAAAPTSAAARTPVREQAVVRRPAARARPPARALSPLADVEPAIARSLRAAAAASRAGRAPAREHVVCSDERQADERVALLRLHEAAPRLRAVLDLDSDEDAEVLVAVVRAWLRYPRAEETADAAALLPPDLHDLRTHQPLLRTPRWRRLGLAPPHPLP